MNKFLSYIIIVVCFFLFENTVYSQTKDLTKEPDPKVIKEELDKCKSSTEKIYKRWSGGSELIEEEYNLLQGCYTNFSNQIKFNSEVMTLISSELERGKIKDSKIVGGLVGLKYDVTDTRGRVIGSIKKNNLNQYEFDGEEDYTFMQQKVDPQNGKIKISFRPTSLDAVYTSLNLNLSENSITILDADKKFNDCTFRIITKD